MAGIPKINSYLWQRIARKSTSWPCPTPRFPQLRSHNNAMMHRSVRFVATAGRATAVSRGARGPFPPAALPCQLSLASSLASRPVGSLAKSQHRHIRFLSSISDEPKLKLTPMTASDKTALLKEFSSSNPNDPDFGVDKYRDLVNVSQAQRTNYNLSHKTPGTASTLPPPQRSE